MNNEKKVAWFSCRATSAIACKLALKEDKDVEVYYIETGSHHPDNQRFLKQCEEMYGKKITILRSAYKRNARMARILRAEDYDFKKKEVKLWNL